MCTGLLIRQVYKQWVTEKGTMKTFQCQIVFKSFPVQDMIEKTHLRNSGSMNGCPSTTKGAYSLDKIAYSMHNQRRVNQLWKIYTSA